MFDARPRPLFLEDWPLFIADCAMKELLAAEKLEVFTQVAEVGWMIEPSKGRRIAHLSDLTNNGTLFLAGWRANTERPPCA